MGRKRFKLRITNRFIPEIKLKSFEQFKATEFKVDIEDQIIDEKLKEISNQNKQFEDKKEDDKAKMVTRLFLIIRQQ